MPSKRTAIALTICALAIVTGFAYRSGLPTMILPPDAVLPDNSRYYGDVHNGKFDGFGTWESAGGARYEGHFKNGLFHGAGEYWGAEGSHYKGELAEGLMSGVGAVEWANGTKYVGHFKQGLPHGEGEYTGPNGEVFAGTFERGEVLSGTYQDPSGEVTYTGGFENWLFHGEGVYEVEGERYEGTFEKGVLTGKGKASLADGSTYEGNFKDWSFNGTGVLVEEDGDRYEGEFEYGLYHGEGELFLAEPFEGLTSLKGTWEYGYLPDDPRDKVEDHRAEIESILYSQPALINNALSKVAPERADEIDLFFVGVAGYSMQDVFLKEIRFIHDWFVESGFAAGRSLLLVNHYSTVTSTPVATKTALKRVLDGIAQKMDLENDVLFLYLTSHGSEEHEFSIQLAGVNLPSIGKQDLADLLAASPIKWKVVAISACYSGGFLPLLQDAHTLVMTSAREDRTSFGCGDDSDMTYFAKAYFKEALPKAESFVSAFDDARQRIEAWEKADFPDSPRSEPQIWVGKEIESHLQVWRGQVAQKATERP